MGTFGICDYLDQHNIRSCITNLSLYSKETARSVLIRQITELQPTYIGLVLHWKELTHSFIQTGSLLREHFPNVPIIVGGMTASCYPTELMTNMPFIDYIITGDAEVSLLKLIQGVNDPSSIENIVYRKNGAIVCSHRRFVADKDLFNSISFSRLDFLQDHGAYVARINEYLGFPLFVGRGCAYDCEHCGGSRSAFMKHSQRRHPAIRNTQNIVNDILVLMEEFGCTRMLLSHLSSVCKNVLQSIVSLPNVQGRLVLNLEPWDLPDEGLFLLHEKMSRGVAIKPYVILTPKSKHTDTDHTDWHYKKYRNFPIDHLTTNEMITRGQYAHVEVFKGYFTSIHTSLDVLFQEMEEVHHIRKEHRFKDVSIHFLAFSTDPTSRLSETNPTNESDLSLTSINESILFDRSLSTNILRHRPVSISQENQQVFEEVLFLSDFLFLHTPFLYWLLTENLEFADFIRILRHASQYYFYNLDGISYEISVSSTTLAFNCLKNALKESGILKPYFEQALDLCIKYAVFKRLRRLSGKKTGQLPQYLTLNKDSIFVSEYTFCNLAMATEMSNFTTTRVSDDTPNQGGRCVYMFTSDSLVQLTWEELELLKLFSGILETTIIIKKLQAIKQEGGKWVEQRIRTLYEQGVLVDT